MLFSPSNYLLGNPALQSSQMIRMNYNSSASDIVEEVLTFGGQSASGMFNLTAIQPDYYSYEGDSNTRKFPYDRESSSSFSGLCLTSGDPAIDVFSHYSSASPLQRQ